MVNLLCEHSELFSETWPTSGMMLDGKVFALPTQAHLTTDSESLSLPTPTTQDSSGSCRDHGGDLLHEVTCGCSRTTRRKLMPTPTTMDAKATNDYDTALKFLREGRQNCLTYEMMPTPVASEGTKAPSQQTSEVKSKTGQVWLSNVAKDVEISWGKFEPAIRRWESIIGRTAPAPTKPDGKDGAHRLSSEFTEWMMGVPAGWITGVGLSRNDELKACGNGVVPQQAELALRMLLEVER
jgi:DNA (cytosine-5)-methyltransferase 1